MSCSRPRSPYPPGEARTVKKNPALAGAKRLDAGLARGRIPAVPRRHSTRACSDPQARALLLPYVLSRAEEEEAVFFEAHLLTCDACFRDLKFLDRAGTLIHGLMPRAAHA